MISERLRKTRELRNLGVRELARAADLSATMISRYERGEREPQARSVWALARALEVSSDYLLGLTDDPTPPGGSPELSEHERRIIAALRAGDIERAMRLLLDMQ